MGFLGTTTTNNTQEPTLAGNQSEATADLTRTDVSEKTEIRLSPLTLRSLESLASTNPGIVHRGGSMLQVKNFNSTVIALAKTDQELPPFVLEYLPSFLLAHSKFEAPVVEFGEKELLIRGGEALQVFAYADPRFINHPPNKRPKLPSVDVEVTLSEKQVESIRDYYGVAIFGNDSEIVFRWEDIESIIPDSYKVSFSFKGVTWWVGSVMEYFLMSEELSNQTVYSGYTDTETYQDLIEAPQEIRAIIQSFRGPLAEAATIARELVESHKQNVDSFKRFAEKPPAITVEVGKANMNARKTTRKRTKKELVELKVFTYYDPEETDSGVPPDPKFDDALRRLIGRDFDIVRKYTLYGERAVGWVCESEKEAARIIRIFVKLRLDYYTNISNNQQEMQRFLARHNISPEPYAPAYLKDVINAGTRGTAP